MILSESIIQNGGDGVLHSFFLANQKYDSETTPFKFHFNKSSTSIIELKCNFFVKWQDHVYDFEIMIWNHNSDSGILQRPVSATLRYYTNSDNVSNKGRISLVNYYSKAY